MSSYVRGHKVRNHSYSYLMHQLTVARLLVCLQGFCLEHPYQLTELLTGYDISRDPPVTTISVDGRDATVAVIADAWAYIDSHGRGTALWIEIDKGTEFRRKYLDLLSARIAMIKSGQYREYFGTEVAILCYLVTGRSSEERNTRLDTLRRWTRWELKKQKLEDWASVFRFSAIAWEEMYAQTHRLFAEPSWYLVDSDEPVPLFDPITTNTTEATDGDASFTSDHRD